MSACKHDTLEHIGEQKTDDGVNSYYRCKACGTLLVLTPSRKVFGIHPAKDEHSGAQQ